MACMKTCNNVTMSRRKYSLDSFVILPFHSVLWYVQLFRPRHC